MGKKGLHIDSFVSQYKYIESLEKCIFLHNMPYLNESKISFAWSDLVRFHLQCLPVCAFRFVWNNNWNTVNTVIVVRQGTKVNLG